MTISDAFMKAICEHVERSQWKVFTCNSIAAGMGRPRNSVREALSKMTKRGLIEKSLASSGGTFVYVRTEMPYVPLENNVSKYDFGCLMDAWKAIKHPKQEQKDTPRGFGEFKDGTSL